MMNFLNLEYFVVTAEEMNFTRAAKRLYISQQSLSNHIAKLEDYFGVSLFDRKNPMTLTDAGKSLLASARIILEDKRYLELKIQDIRDFRNAELTIGIPVSRGVMILPYLLSAYKKEFPNIQIHLIEGTTQEITEALYQGRADLIIGLELNDPERLENVTLREEKTLIVVPDVLFRSCFSEEEQKEMEKKKKLPMKTFAECPFIIGFGWIKDIVYKTCTEEEIHLNVILRSNNINTTVAMCLMDYGVTVVPDVYIRLNRQADEAMREGKIHCFELSNPAAHRRLGIGYLKNKYQSRASEEFVRIARKVWEEFKW